MTDPGPGPARSIEQWQAKLLARIDRLAREYAMVQARGFTGYDGTDGSPEQEWRSHLDALEAERETTEQLAIELGIPPQWVEHARTNGTEAAELPPPAPEIANTVVDQTSQADISGAASASKQLFIDMAVVDVWHVHRMALLTAARDSRLNAGRLGLGADPIADRQFHRNMALHHQRAAGLSDAAQLSAPEVAALWDSPQVRTARRQAAQQINRWDDLHLEFEWRRYTQPVTDPALPPYIPTDPATGAPTSQAQAPPPAPEELIARAAAALGIDPNRTDRLPIHHATAIDIALPAATIRDWQPGHAPAPPPTATGPDLGPEP
ncbi:hypothetical protein IRT45_26525 [Nocardia sp. BSTN01]|uniref:hypothetical protein n=1 Tax=Nocardia sp. BSTN01 TaxID=2783665 RepID=UPI00188F2FFC|nr:hypothetical protein [Nocardia sp. BSTN01]MBF5000699.1 hypothetical protein [Nocardia sp. BSTN01]